MVTAIRPSLRILKETNMRVFFPGLSTEAHRERERGLELVAAFADCGVDMVAEMPADACFCGTVWNAEQCRGLRVPVFHYSWDVYPFQVAEHPDVWLPYLRDLRDARAVFVPSQSCAQRTRQYIGRDSVVMHPPVKLWDATVARGDYVVDVMRQYPDPNRSIVEWACQKLGIPCIEMDHKLQWEEYKIAVAGCRLLVSAYFEASTGGLTLMEGYALGKPLLLARSPYNGAREYFPDAANFLWSDRDELLEKLAAAYELPHHSDGAMVQKYSDASFARRITCSMKQFM